MKLLSEYYSEDEDKCALIYHKEDGSRVVQFIRNDWLIKEVACESSQADDLADDWVRQRLNK